MNWLVAILQDQSHVRSDCECKYLLTAQMEYSISNKSNTEYVYLAFVLLIVDPIGKMENSSLILNELSVGSNVFWSIGLTVRPRQRFKFA